MDHCAICFETMDMLAFQDERTQTSTCVKLSCHHAYHTLCIVDCMSKMNYKCVQCNTEKDPVKELSEAGMSASLIRKLKADDKVKPFLEEYKEAKEEYAETVSQLKRDIREYSKKRAEELCIPEKRKYMTSCISELKRVTTTVAKAKGNEYLGVLKRQVRYYYGGIFENNFFGRQTAHSLYRLKHPHLYLDL